MSYPNRNDIIQTIRQNIDNFRAEHPRASFNEIIEEFGSVTEVAASFLDELPEQEISSILQKKRKMLHIFFALFLICAMIFFVVLYNLSSWAEEEALIFNEGMYIYNDTEETSEILEKLLDIEEFSEN
ncbi:MAG: hypothetical protein HFJ05_09925 [Eubacterium sp.]|nr:hypothetical protein [Eubacterium sp.]